MKPEAARRLATQETSAAVWSIGSTTATTLESSDSLELPVDSEDSETRSTGAWASPAGTL